MIKDKKVIAVDVDGVVADLLPEWLSWYNGEYNDDLTVDRITAWNTHLFVKPSCGTEIYKYLRLPELYDGVKPIAGAKQAIQTLRNLGHRVIFLTSTVLGQQGRKMKWLEEHGFLTLSNGCNSDDYVEAKDKSLIRADFLVDDYEKNLIGFHGRTILFDQPYNRHVFKDIHFIARCWANVVQYIKETA